MSEKIHVLQVMPEFGLAGAEIMCEQLVDGLLSTGQYEIFIVSLYTYHSPITVRMEQKGINLIYLGKKHGCDPSIVFKLIKIMKRCRIQIVHTHRYTMIYAVPAAIYANVPIRIHTIHNVATKEVRHIYRHIAGFFYKYCQVVPVSISPIIKKTVIEEYKMDESIPLVYNGIDLSRCLLKEDYGVHGIFHFLHIGRMDEQKNHRMILQTINRLKCTGRQFFIDFIGAGPYENKLRDLVKEMNLQDYVSFCGLKNNVYSYLNRADCFLLPSLYEGMPMTLIEAMGSGLPIIASAVGGIPDMITNEESGILIPPTEDELYVAMCRMMDMSVVQREKFGKNALIRSQSFSVEQMYSGYDKIYKSEMLKRFS